MWKYSDTESLTSKPWAVQWNVATEMLEYTKGKVAKILIPYSITKKDQLKQIIDHYVH